MSYKDYIASNPNVMQGQPCVQGTRVTVSNLVQQISAGRSIQELCEDYPYLDAIKIRAALAFAADLASMESYELLAS
jgi:uncharacterized protein (DUF433 family)